MCPRPLQAPKHHAPIISVIGSSLTGLDSRESASVDGRGISRRVRPPTRTQAPSSRQENWSPGPLCQGLGRRWGLENPCRLLGKIFLLYRGRGKGREGGRERAQRARHVGVGEIATDQKSLWQAVLGCDVWGGTKSLAATQGSLQGLTEKPRCS